MFTGCFGRGDELDELVNEYPLFKHRISIKAVKPVLEGLCMTKLRFE